MINDPRTYDVSPDGRRFVFVKSALTSNAAGPPPAVVVLNWAEELKRRVPVN